MDTETLVAKVFLKPEIWDKRLKMHSNRVVVDRCWQKIANDMGAEEAVLRKKWKYLRDQFSVEFGKIKQPRSGDPGVESQDPKWPHFKSLLFLKDVVRPRASPGNLTSKKPAESNETSLDNFSETQVTVHENKNTEGDSFPLDEQGTEEPAGVSREDNGNAKDTLRKKRKRIQTNAKYNEILIEMEKRKVKILEEVMKTSQNENEDLLFFRSLLSHVSRIADNMKLRFRARIQEVVEEFAYNSGPSSAEIP